MITRFLVILILLLVSAQPASALSIVCMLNQIRTTLVAKRPTIETVAPTLVVSDNVGAQKTSPIARVETITDLTPLVDRRARRREKLETYSGNGSVHVETEANGYQPHVLADPDTTNADVFKDPFQFEGIYRLRKQRGQSESEITLKSFEAARNYVQNFPALEAGGFSPRDYTGWTKVYCRLRASFFYEKFVGWETKLSNGDFARYRYDYVPGTGVHWNIEITRSTSRGKRETSKLAVKFLCEGHECSEKEALNYLTQMNR